MLEPVIPTEIIVPAAAPVAPTAPAAAPITDEATKKELETLRGHNKKLLDAQKKAEERAKTSEEKLAKFGAALGVDAASDPKALQEKRDADNRAAEQRDRVIEKATLRALLGKPGVSADDADLITLAAQRNPGVTIDDTGAVIGLDEALKGILARPMFAVAGTPSTPAPTPTPARVSPGASVDLDPKFSKVTTMSELAKLGPSGMEEYAKKYPERYRAMEEADSALRSRPRGFV